MGSDSTVKNCWNCGYKKNKQISLFGVCTYFELKEMEAKEIPSEIVDIGCKNWIDKIIRTILVVFDGEIL